MPDEDFLSRAQTVIGREFRNPELLHTALTHASLADCRLDSNERLEFLGDAILGAVVCTELFDRYQDWFEGDLTKVKSAVVSRRTCAEMSDEIGLTDLLLLGKGVAGRNSLPLSLRAAVFESVVGALFLDGGFDAAQEFILKHTKPHILSSAQSTDQNNHKSTLQQLAQRNLNSTPRYETLDEQGPDHSKCFEICVVISHTRFPSAWGPSKKAAEQEAARKALNVLRANGDTIPHNGTGPHH